MAAGCSASSSATGLSQKSAAAATVSEPTPATEAGTAAERQATGDSPGTLDTGAPRLPARIADGTGTEVVVESIDRIIPVDGDLAEIVFALGLGDRVVATDLSATHPRRADELPEIGYQRALTAEPIAAFEPTVVLATDLAGPPETLDGLRALGIPVVVIQRDQTLAGPPAKIRAVAHALGVPERGELLASGVEAAIAEAAERAAELGPGPRVAVLYLRGERVQLLFGADNTVSAVLTAAGAVDVGAELGISDTQQITAESIVLAAPDVYVVTTSGLESVGGIDGLLAIPGIGETPAGRSRQVFVFEDQFLLGGGPRTGDLLTELTETLPRKPSGEPTP